MLKDAARPYNEPEFEIFEFVSASDMAASENLKTLMFADRIPYDLSTDGLCRDLVSQFFDDAMYNWNFEDLQWGAH
jgi:hypothetical protein